MFECMCPKLLYVTHSCRLALQSNVHGVRNYFAQMGKKGSPIWKNYNVNSMYISLNEHELQCLCEWCVARSCFVSHRVPCACKYRLNPRRAMLWRQIVPAVVQNWEGEPPWPPGMVTPTSLLSDFKKWNIYFCGDQKSNHLPPPGFGHGHELTLFITQNKTWAFKIVHTSKQLCLIIISKNFFIFKEHASIMFLMTLLAYFRNDLRIITVCEIRTLFCIAKLRWLASSHVSFTVLVNVI